MSRDLLRKRKRPSPPPIHRGPAPQHRHASSSAWARLFRASTICRARLRLRINPRLRASTRPCRAARSKQVGLRTSPFSIPMRVGPTLRRCLTRARGSPVPSSLRRSRARPWTSEHKRATRLRRRRRDDRRSSRRRRVPRTGPRLVNPLLHRHAQQRPSRVQHQLRLQRQFHLQRPASRALRRLPLLALQSPKPPRGRFPLRLLRSRHPPRQRLPRRRQLPRLRQLQRRHRRLRPPHRPRQPQCRRPRRAHRPRMPTTALSAMYLDVIEARSTHSMPKLPSRCGLP